MMNIFGQKNTKIILKLPTTNKQPKTNSPIGFKRLIDRRLLAKVIAYSLFSFFIHSNLVLYCNKGPSRKSILCNTGLSIPRFFLLKNIFCRTPGQVFSLGVDFVLPLPQQQEQPSPKSI